jgi:hypothetical protein
MEVNVDFLIKVLYSSTVINLLIFSFKNLIESLSVFIFTYLEIMTLLLCTICTILLLCNQSFHLLPFFYFGGLYAGIKQKPFTFAILGVFIAWFYILKKVFNSKVL